MFPQNNNIFTERKIKLDFNATVNKQMSTYLSKFVKYFPINTTIKINCEHINSPVHYVNSYLKHIMYFTYTIKAIYLLLELILLI